MHFAYVVFRNGNDEMISISDAEHHNCLHNNVYSVQTRLNLRGISWREVRSVAVAASSMSSEDAADKRNYKPVFTSLGH